MSIVGSGVITLLLEKSTRLPSKFERKRPSLPFKRDNRLFPFAIPRAPIDGAEPLVATGTAASPPRTAAGFTNEKTSICNLCQRSKKSGFSDRATTSLSGKTPPCRTTSIVSWPDIHSLARGSALKESFASTNFAMASRSSAQRLFTSCRRTEMSSWPRVRDESTDDADGRTQGGGTQMDSAIRSLGEKPKSCCISSESTPSKIAKATEGVNFLRATAASSADAKASSESGHAHPIPAAVLE